MVRWRKTAQLPSTHGDSENECMSVQRNDCPNNPSGLYKCRYQPVLAGAGKALVDNASGVTALPIGAHAADLCLVEVAKAVVVVMLNVQTWAHSPIGIALVKTGMSDLHTQISNYRSVQHRCTLPKAELNARYLSI